VASADTAEGGNDTPNASVSGKAGPQSQHKATSGKTAVSAQRNTQRKNDLASGAKHSPNPRKSGVAAAASVPSTPGSPDPAAVIGELFNGLGLAVRDINDRMTHSPASSAVGSGLFVPINSLFAGGGRCGLVCDGADGTQAHPNGVSGGWLFGDGGDGWSSTVAGVSGGRGGDGGVLQGNGGKGGNGGVGVNGSAGSTGVNGGRGADGVAAGNGGAGGNAGFLFGRGGDGGAGGKGSTGGAGAHGTDAVPAEDDGGPGGAGGTGGSGGAGGAGGKGSMFTGLGGNGGAGGAAGAGGAGGYGGTGGATVITLPDGKVKDSDAVGGIAGQGGAAGQAGLSGAGGAGGVWGQAGTNGPGGAAATGGKAGGAGGAGGLTGRLPLLDLTTATPAQQQLGATLKTLALQLQQFTGIQGLTEDGQLIGPFNTYLQNPVIGAALLGLANAVTSSTLTAHTREIVVLAVGGQWGSEYELYAHKLTAALAGVPQDAIDSLASGQAPVGLTGNDLIAAQFVQSLVTTHYVDDALYDAALTAFGQVGVTDMVNLAGTYLGASIMLNAFEVKGPGTVARPPIAPSPATPWQGGDGGLGGRLPLLDLDTATQAQKDLAVTLTALAVQLEQHTGIQGMTEDGQLIGPFNAYLQNPVIGTALLNVANAVTASTLSAKTREIVVLSVGGQWGSAYELYAHKLTAGLAGVPQDAIDSLASGQAPVGLTGNDLIAAQFVQQLVTTYHVDDELYHAAEAAFGQVGVTDMVNLAGTYLGASIMLNAFQVPVP
jgi:alkylhydroperoxidase family enzyme